MAGVKVRLEVRTTPSAVLELLNPKVTFADGWVCRTTVKEAVAPVSRVELVQVNELPDTSRGVGGFGHTGR